MTEQPAIPDEPDDDELDDPWHDSIVEAQESYGGPEVLALVAIVMAVASFLGNGVMAGTTYVTPLLEGLREDNGTRVVVGLVVGAVLALVPVCLGWWASSRALPDDARWVLPVARAAILLGLASAVLRLVVAVVTAAQDGPVGFSFL